MPAGGRWQAVRGVLVPLTRRGTARFVAISTATGLVVAAGAVAVAGPWDGGQRKAERVRAAAADRGHSARRAPARPPAAPVLAGPAAGGRPPAAADVAAALEPLLRDPALGAHASASVVDVAGGGRLFGSDESTAFTPASTIKLATSAAALAALGGDHRIETTVMLGDDGIVLVGGGDPTLTAHPAASGERFASLPALADATARALKARGTARTRLSYDLSRYSGPVQHPIGPNDNLAPVSPLMIDEGRLDDSDHGPAARSADPAGDAARKFAELLGERGVQVDGPAEEGRAPASARRIAAVSSAPLAELVERALTNSDNDIAEALARQTALADGRPASFDGAARAVEARLSRIGLPMDGAHVADGSGLDRSDRVSAELLARLLARASDARAPELRPVLTGLPVAGFSGTLRGRYADAAEGRGLVRAKTGTLTGVNTLAGTVVTPGGRLLAFAFMADGTVDAEGAQRALDRLAVGAGSLR
ncbi:D-alanyl-D-alanine carboxypeptidase/D-alanyl-D-alanine-endopeptidase [Streptomyces sp. AV19]|uniref:D-alanyl-D-alanine carboxypeptidase/D-alanyl-D-alanine endopeptidase n=1 Tax=Streptomyces sp. AV19 TaxID=2793068 RepID=UPI0018FE45F0|nr:D-alanyl-D-alanine carboxypeptidase/D-alanyl-D-alanine-endopeptidase [Streptomyces sp. AV19]MBH1934933.1 D-alanyl-D-alanine carboxypeptidase/D-alanyl-D-alanine-endopeptidase [Streptomyces sp. AV19]MDG4534538.1 D-alanyl-D-alanine carboxypeptidase/D-alanyl-D-alanine-endopeptidase [Streptomyces sp. AV19]